VKMDDPTAREIRSLLDKILKRNIEGFIGTTFGIGALPLNWATISCLILLAERENEIDSFGLDPSERYTQDTFLDELREIGIESDAEPKKALQEMTQKGYLNVDNKGRFCAEKQTISMTHLIDRIFPGMPGMNLVAYFIQTMDEVQSGRKDVKDAAGQFDQTLKIHGTTLKKRNAGPVTKKTLKPSVEQIAAFKKGESRAVVCSQPKLFSDGRSGTKEIREVSFGIALSGQDKSQENCPEIFEESKAQKPDMKGVEQRETPGGQTEIKGAHTAEMSSETLQNIPLEAGPESLNSADEEAATDITSEAAHSGCKDDLMPSELEAQEEAFFKDSGAELERIKTVMPGETLPRPETRSGTENIPNEHVQDSDDIIEKRIAAFEEDLAMQCPLCRSAKIQINETAMGKVYYKCPNKKCNFVSWGKPYHLACPLCNNPFLIEISDKNGAKIIKCPRATCRYQQKSPGLITKECREKAGIPSKETTNNSESFRKPRRRVVRRKVVRKKR